MVQLPAGRLVLLRTILRSVATTERTAPLAGAGGRRAFTYAGVLRRSLAGRPMTSVQIHRRNNPSANDGQDNGDQCDERAEDHVVQMPALHRVLRRRQAPRDLRPRLLQLAPEEGDALLEHALVLLEAQDLGAQPPELAAQGVDVGDVVLDLGGGAAQGGREPSGHGRDRRRDAAARRRRVADPATSAPAVLAAPGGYLKSLSTNRQRIADGPGSGPPYSNSP